jgi:hypothetical protein
MMCFCHLGLWVAMAFPGIANDCNSQLDLSNKLLCSVNEDCVQKLCPQEVSVSTNHLRACKPFGTLPPIVRVLDY